MDHNPLLAFLDESDEALQAVALAFVRLEAQPGDVRTLNAIVQGIHGIRGNAPFFGLFSVERLAHQMEDLLAPLRERRARAGQTEISSLLAGLELLQSMLRNVRQGRPELIHGAERELDALCVRLKRSAHAGYPDEAGAWQGVWAQLEHLATLGARGELTGPIDALRYTLLSLAPAAEGLLASANAGVRAPPRLDGAAVDAANPALALDELGRLLQPMFDEVLPAPTAERVRQLLELVLGSVSDEAHAIAARALGEHDSLVAAVGFVPLLREMLLDRVSEIQSAVSSGPRAGTSGDPPSGAPAGSGNESAHSRSMRVEEAKVDEFLDYVGDLIITREMFGNVGKRLRKLEEHASLSSEFQRAMVAFTALSHNLQRSIMELRKVPAKWALGRIPHLVRDLSEQAGRQATVTLVGSEICVDKSLMESLEAPLLHMVTNAVCHGLEAPEDRRRQGKPPAGHVEVSVAETSAELICSIRDDGAGIDVDALCARAVALGVLTARAAAQLNRQKAFQLIFTAGLSTAKQITDVSGDGVGMDVVKRHVSELGGRIEIASEPGVGSTFTIYLPKAVTLQILDGFLVQVGDERLVLPLRAISESFRPTPDQLHMIAEHGECVSRRGRVFPLVRFNRVLALGAADRCPSEAIVVSIEVADGHPAGLLVDQVLGVQQVVLREIAGIDTEGQVFAGGAVLGDGRVAMVVDVEKLGALAAAQMARA